MKIDFKSVRTSKDIIISTIVLITGAGLYFFNAALGFTIAACGVLLFLFYKNGYKRNAENILFTKKAIDVAAGCRQSIKDFLEGKSNDVEIKEAGQGKAIRLEVYFSKTAGLAYAQLYDFSNYAYEKAMDIVELHSARAEKLISKL